MNTNIYVGQPFAVRLNTKTDLSTATSLKIRAKYDGSEIAIFYDATLVTGSTSVIEASIPSVNNSVASTVEFRAWVVFPGDTGAVPGTPFKLKIQDV